MGMFSFLLSLTIGKKEIISELDFWFHVLIEYKNHKKSNF